MEYWIDYGPEKCAGITGMKMPTKYVVEMFIDRVAASKNYQREKYTDESPLAYYEHGKQYHIIHEESRELLERLLHMLAERGEEETYAYIRYEVLKNKRKKDK